MISNSPETTDPLSQIIALLRPRAMVAKGISGAGAWAVSYSAFGQPGFCAVTEGRCRLAVEGEAPVILEAGDFVLLPATPAFVMSGFEPATPKRIDPATAALTPGDDIRHGRADGPADVRLRGGYFAFDSPDAALLVSLLPAMIHIHGDERLAMLVRLFGEEAGAQRAGRELVLTRLVEVLLIEALRATQGKNAPAGLVARIGGRARGRSAAPHARRSGAVMDRGRTGEGSRHVAFGVLRSLHAHGGLAADGISVVLAHGAGQGFPAGQRHGAR